MYPPSMSSVLAMKCNTVRVAMVGVSSPRSRTTAMTAGDTQSWVQRGEVIDCLGGLKVRALVMLLSCND